MVIFTHFEWFKALWVCPLINYILSSDLIIKEGKLSERQVIDTLNVQSLTCSLPNLVKKIGGICATPNVKNSTPIHIIHMYTLLNNITYIVKGSWVQLQARQEMVLHTKHFFLANHHTFSAETSPWSAKRSCIFKIRKLIKRLHFTLPY